MEPHIGELTTSCEDLCPGGGFECNGLIASVEDGFSLGFTDVTAQSR